MNSFNAIADAYDMDFTNSRVGRMQRQRVYFHLNRLFAKRFLNEVLELNCGTGEDARWLGEKGCKVLATDASEEMIVVAKQKIAAHNLEDRVTCACLRIEDVVGLDPKNQRDLIFSNFGGLNCIAPDDLKKASLALSKVLNAKGYFVAVIMPRLCCWERFFFRFKKDAKKAKRRQSLTSIPAPLDENTVVDTWYYNPKEFYRYFEADFNFIKVYPIGFFLPPSYLDNWFVKHPFLLKILNQLEALLPSGLFFSKRSDHCMIILQKK